MVGDFCFTIYTVENGAAELTLPKDRYITIFAAEAVMNARNMAEEISDSITRL